MRKNGIAIIVLALASACAAEVTDADSPTPASPTPAESGLSYDAEADEPLPESQPEALAELVVGAHTFYFYEAGPGRLLYAERRPIDTPSLLEGIDRPLIPSEIYRRFSEEPIPAAILEYERRHGIVPMSEDDDLDSLAEGEPLVNKHEAGSTHFRDAHCPTKAFPGAFAVFHQQYQRDRAAADTHIAVRKFCWASEFTNTWTEEATAAVSSHTVAAVRGDVCYTHTWDSGSQTWTVLQGEQWNFWAANTPKIWWGNKYCKPSKDVACSPSYGSVIAPMIGRVSCAAGDAWRFGGGFFKHELTHPAAYP